jgi:endonuclease/exonuclease/phosphatase family metal-dependent hydrolase
MRVLSYNIHGWRTIRDQLNLELLVDLLRSTKADVIGLNEVYHPVPTESGSALSRLAERLGMRVAFAAKRACGYPGDIASGASGNALLSRFPFASVFSGLFTPLEGKRQRGWLEGRIEVDGGRTLSVVVTHLDPSAERVRQAQWAELFAWFEADGKRPDLILGDFNCLNPRDSEHSPEARAAWSALPAVAQHLINAPDGPQVARQIEQAGYLDTGARLGHGGPGTYVPAQTPVRLDYIWLRADWLGHLGDVGIIEEAAGQEASDHRPVFADLTLTIGGR